MLTHVAGIPKYFSQCAIQHYMFPVNLYLVLVILQSNSFAWHSAGGMSPVPQPEQTPGILQVQGHSLSWSHTLPWALTPGRSDNDLWDAILIIASEVHFQLSGQGWGN